MSTRGVIGFQINAKIKATYNHLDSYPSYLGREVMEFLSKLNADELTKLKNNADKIKWVTEDDKPSKQDLAKFERFSQKDNAKDWYWLLRSTQGIETLELVYSGELDTLIDSTSFLGTFGCEWGYIVNFDDGTLDTYRWHKKSASGYELVYRIELSALYRKTSAAIDKIIKDLSRTRNRLQNQRTLNANSTINQL